jgi:hypothetical protein
MAAAVIQATEWTVTQDNGGSLRGERRRTALMGEGAASCINAGGFPLVSLECGTVVAGESPFAPQALRAVRSKGLAPRALFPEQLPGTPLTRRAPRQG